MTHHQKEKKFHGIPIEGRDVGISRRTSRENCYSYFQAFMGERWIELVSREGIIAEKCKLFWQE